MIGGHKEGKSGHSWPHLTQFCLLTPNFHMLPGLCRLAGAMVGGVLPGHNRPAALEVGL